MKKYDKDKILLPTKMPIKLAISKKNLSLTLRSSYHSPRTLMVNTTAESCRLVF